MVIKSVRKSYGVPGAAVEALIRKRWIFIKDLAGKRGLEKGTWIRLTVSDKADDDFPLEALMELK